MESSLRLHFFYLIDIKRISSLNSLFIKRKNIPFVINIEQKSALTNVLMNKTKKVIINIIFIISNFSSYILNILINTV